MFAKPSVQITTRDPGFPWTANYTEANRAGPKAVFPFSFTLEHFSIKVSSV